MIKQVRVKRHRTRQATLGQAGWTACKVREGGVRKKEADRDYGICLGLWSSTTRDSRGFRKDEERGGLIVSSSLKFCLKGGIINISIN